MTDVHTMPAGHTSRPCKALETDEGCYWCCSRCDYDQHICPGCGTSLSHLGREVRVEWFDLQVDDGKVVQQKKVVTYTEHGECT